MRFLADENFRLDVIKFLKSEGHDVKGVIPQASDEAVADSLKNGKTFLVEENSAIELE